MRAAFRVLFASIGVGVASGAVFGTESVRGVVFHDMNRNGVRDAAEPGVANVRVSNGRDVVATAADGSYELELELGGDDGRDGGIVFVIKPAGWMVPVDDRGLAQFHYVHKPEGSRADLEFAGVAPTGPLPESVDFPLRASEEPESFRVVLFGDPQPYSIEEVNEFAHDVVEDVIAELGDRSSPAHGALFGVSMGDLVGDDLELFVPLNRVVSAMGVPWVNVYGNHDMNFDTAHDWEADETFERVYGPPTYAFNVGPVHFVVLDDVYYEGRPEDRPMGPYRAELTDRIMAFLEADLAAHEHKRLTVLMMHIPFFELPESQRARVLEMLSGRASLSLSAHWHRQEDFFFPMPAGGADEGKGGGMHHHRVLGTTSGSWWQGAPDEFGLPHAMMRDGKPNGWTVLSIETGADGRVDYSMRYKAARRPWSDQMHVWAPSEVAVEDVRAGEGVEVIANVYAGSLRSVVEMRVRSVATGDAPGWRAMEMFEGVDPHWAELKRLEESERPPRGRKLTDLDAETLLWRGALPAGLSPGAHVVEVRTVDMFGQRFEGRRVLRVTGPGETLASER